MFMISALGSRRIPAGVRARCGRLPPVHAAEPLVCGVLAVIQALACIHPIDKIVFHGLLGLAAPMDETAREVLFCCIPLRVLFFLRNPGLVALYNARSATAGGRPSAASR